MDRMEDYIITFSGIRFTPLSPDSKAVRLLDIAHSLSLLCRANGHFKSFFSVAQHCLNCAREAAARGYSRKVQLACLLHDASEAYISDVTRPVKQNMPDYIGIEITLQDCIWNAFRISLTPEEEAQVSDVDDAMLFAEFEELMGEKVLKEKPEIKSAPDFCSREFLAVEREYESMYGKLVSETGSL